MKRLIVVLVALVILLIVNSIMSASAATVQKVKEIKERVPEIGLTIARPVMLKWERVAICETGANWGFRGPIYSGALGISNHNWIAYGGQEFAPSADLATPQEQAYIAWQIQGNNYVPDQYGCTGAW